MKQNIVKVAAVTPKTAIGKPEKNREYIFESALNCIKETESDILVFPELCMTGYTCADLFNMGYLIEEAMQATSALAKDLAGSDAVFIVGLPVRLGNQLFNCAAVISCGRIAGIVPKSYIPNYNEFYESRWFSPAKNTSCRSIEVSGETIPFGTDLIQNPHRLNLGVVVFYNSHTKVAAEDEIWVTFIDCISCINDSTSCFLTKVSVKSCDCNAIAGNQVIQHCTRRNRGQLVDVSDQNNAGVRLKDNCIKQKLCQVDTHHGNLVNNYEAAINA